MYIDIFRFDLCKVGHNKSGFLIISFIENEDSIKKMNINEFIYEFIKCHVSNNMG
jgi:hypothetical protein